MYRTLQAVYRYVTENDIINDLWTGKIFGENVAKEKVAGNNLFKSTVALILEIQKTLKDLKIGAFLTLGHSTIIKYYKRIRLVVELMKELIILLGKKMSFWRANTQKVF